jgi:hypothetical protein
VIFIEDPEFARERDEIFSDDEFFRLQLWLAASPASGDVIPGSGGCRKLRWAAKGRGKRGGARVIYFYRITASQILLLKTYVKNAKQNLTPGEIIRLKQKIRP